MSAFLGRITHRVELLRGRAVDADTRRVLGELRLELGDLALDALDVLLRAFDVVVLLGDAAGAARRRRERPGRDRLASRGSRPGSTPPRTPRSGCPHRAAGSPRGRPPAARCGACAWSAATFVVVLRAQLLGLRVAALARSLREPRAEVGLGLARAGHELLRRTAPERHRLRLVEPVGVVLQPAAVGLGVARRSGQLVERRALARRRFEVGERQRNIRGGRPVDGDGALGEGGQPCVLDGLVDLRLGVQQAHARAADQHRHVGQRGACGSGTAQRQVERLHAARRRGRRRRRARGDRSGGGHCRRGAGRGRGRCGGRRRRRRPVAMRP